MVQEESTAGSRVMQAMTKPCIAAPGAPSRHTPSAHTVEAHTPPAHTPSTCNDTIYTSNGVPLPSPTIGTPFTLSISAPRLPLEWAVCSSFVSATVAAILAVLSS